MLGLSLALTSFCLRLGFLLSPMIGYSVKMFLSNCSFCIMMFRMLGITVSGYECDAFFSSFSFPL